MAMVIAKKKYIKKKCVWTFKELSKQSKEHAIEKYYQDYEYPFLCESIVALLQTHNKYWTKNIEMKFSLSYCQGDGLSFEGTFDLPKYLRYNNKKFRLTKEEKKYIINWIDEVYSTGNTGHYCYASESNIEFNDNDDMLEYYNEEDEFKATILRKKHDRIENKWEEILNTITDDYMKLCKELEDYGYSVLEYRMDNKEFSDHANANGYKYDKEGDLL